MILIWRFGDRVKISKLTYAIIYPFILQAWVSLHTVLKTANLKSHKQHFLSKPPNTMFTNNSAYIVLCTHMYTLLLLLLKTMGRPPDLEYEAHACMHTSICTYTHAHIH